MFKGGRKDVDKKLEEMNEEEKAVFACLEDEKNVLAGAYDELEDDFILMLNGGKPALEYRDPFAFAQHENAGVKLIEDEDK
jgi:hypothetical protein